MENIIMLNGIYMQHNSAKLYEVRYNHSLTGLRYSAINDLWYNMLHIAASTDSEQVFCNGVHE